MLKETFNVCHFLNVRTSIFSHPDCTVGFGISPNPAAKRPLAGLKHYVYHRRSGISPCPEDRPYNIIMTHYNLSRIKSK